MTEKTKKVFNLRLNEDLHKLLKESSEKNNRSFFCRYSRTSERRFVVILIRVPLNVPV